MAQDIIEPLTLEQLREMDGEPVWIMEYPDWGHWELSEDAGDYIADRDPDLYGLTYPDQAGKAGLHKLGWIAYAYPPAHIDREAWVSVNERMPDEDQVVIVIANGKPRENITLDGAFELAEWSERDGWFLECWPDWENPVVTHWMPIPVPPEEAERCAGTI